MRHHNANRKLGRERKVRTALLKSLARSLVVHGKIQTTEAKAKEIRSYVEKLVTNGKTGTLATRRALIAKVGVDGAKKVMADLSPKYADRKGGYTRITKLPRRLSDGAAQAVIEFV
jgi:large subunit ribosomal protein L17